MSDTDIARCKCCGQEMHATDYVQRLRDELRKCGPGWRSCSAGDAYAGDNYVFLRGGGWQKKGVYAVSGGGYYVFDVPELPPDATGSEGSK